MTRRRHPLHRRIALALCLPPLLVALLLGGTEAVLALVGSAPAPSFFREEIAQDGTVHLVQSDQPPIAWTRFLDREFPLHKAPGTRRIFCLGESTTVGYPFEPPAAFSFWMDARLERLLPDDSFEVLNLGSNGWNAEAVLDLVRELGKAEPDLYVVYCGQNQFLDRNLAAVKHPFLHFVRRALSASRFGRLLQVWLAPTEPAQDAGLAERGHSQVLDQPFVSQPELERGYSAYEEHLAAVTQEAERQGARAVFIHPVSDLRDTPVHSSWFADSTPAQDRTRFLEELQDLRKDRLEVEHRSESEDSLETDEIRELLRRLDELGEIDSSVGLLGYERGRCLYLLGRTDEARDCFQKALEGDGHPIRATERIHAALGRIRDQHGALLADPRPLFFAEDPVPGQDRMFTDNCHPQILGHALIAAAVLQTLAEAGIPRPVEEWRFDGESSTEDYARSMGLDVSVQAESFARRALAVLAQQYFSADEPEALEKAGRLFDLAFRQDEECALAHAGIGFLHLMKGEHQAALEAFERAERRDVSSLAPFEKGYKSNPIVRERFEAAGLTFVDGRVRPR